MPSTIISEAGHRTRESHSQANITDELYPIIGRMLDELDRWFQVSELSGAGGHDSQR
jgi:hypothetical protein